MARPSPGRSRPPGTLFRASLLRDFSRGAVATFVVLLAISITVQLTRYLQQAARGRIDPEQVLAFLGLAAFYTLPVLLSITLFVAILMALTRSYRDSEMVVWFASGLSLTAWIRPVLVFALPMVALIGALSLFITPWAESKKEDLRREFESRSDLSAVAPGVFRESRGGERVFFVEGTGVDNQVSNVFVAATKHGRTSVVFAQSGLRETHENGDRFLVLLNGRQYDGVPGAADFRISEFERYSVRVEEAEERVRIAWQRSVSTLQLLSQPTAPNLGELAWRVGMPLSALVLALLAIPLSFVNPRAGRSMNLLLALLVYTIYNNVLSVSQAWISQGKTGILVGALGVHLVMVALLALLFVRRLTLVSFFRLLR